MTDWTIDRYHHVFLDETARFADVLSADGIDATTPVPSCPGWSLSRLVKHTGNVHRWMDHLVTNRVSKPMWSREVPVEFPDDPAEHPRWLADGAKALVATLQATDPDTPVWSWGNDQHARWWSRRVVYETLVHRADAEITLGLAPEIDPELGADGVGEFLDNLRVAPWKREDLRALEGAGQTLHLHATDADGEWMITLDPDGYTWEHGHGKGTVAVRGRAADLLLLLYGRTAPTEDTFQVFGDTALLAHWRSRTGL